MNLDLAQAVAVLERTPRVLQEFLAGLPVSLLHATEGPESWSPCDVVAHLIGAEETDWMVRARVILAQGPDRRFERFNRIEAIDRLKDLPLSELLQTFTDFRRQNLTELATWQLTSDHLRLTGEHPEFGQVTLEQLLATWVVHDLGHLSQIARVVAKQYRVAVGPWQAYLPVLTR